MSLFAADALKGKHALITGAGSGIGQAMAIAFAKAGASVSVVDLSEAAGKETLEMVRSSGRGEVFACDVADDAQVSACFDHAEAALGPLDILINNAGIAHVGTILETGPADLDRLYNVNVKGAYHGMRHALPRFVARKSGVILNLASIASKVGIPNRFAYSMTKGAVLTMTLSVARDFVSHGIRCNCVCPARVHTPFVDGFLAKNYPGREKEMFEKLAAGQPVGRMGRPEEIADLALYLCSDAAGFVTGVAYEIDGGFCNLIT
jgi:2-keto-3-deoxy-L-fuconate dehydrogenase